MIESSDVELPAENTEGGDRLNVKEDGDLSLDNPLGGEIGSSDKAAGGLFGCCGGSSPEDEVVVKSEQLDGAPASTLSVENDFTKTLKSELEQQQSKSKMEKSKTNELGTTEMQQAPAQSGSGCCGGRSGGAGTEIQEPTDADKLTKESLKPDEQPIDLQKRSSTRGSQEKESKKGSISASLAEPGGGGGGCCGGKEASPPTVDVPAEREAKKEGQDKSAEETKEEVAKPPEQQPSIPSRASGSQALRQSESRASGSCCGCCGEAEPEQVVEEAPPDSTEQPGGVPVETAIAEENKPEPVAPRPESPPIPPPVAARPKRAPTILMQEERRAPERPQGETASAALESPPLISPQEIARESPPTFEKSPVFLPQEIGAQPVLPPPPVAGEGEAAAETNDEDAAIFASSDADKLEAYRKKYPEEPEENLQRWATSVGCYMTYDPATRGFFSSVWSDRPLPNAIAFFNIGPEVPLPGAKIRGREKGQLTIERGNQKKVLKAAFVGFCKLCARYDGDFVVIPSRIWMTEALGSVEVVWLDSENHVGVHYQL
eukprot:Gregarina_sp_Poly_1__7119@NODE_389_length_8981_cov_43_318600_g318_i0_p2_GENE_NODE_389_length_8981_cov_43_318600_g318_i0NODE_389_length_8981_cov_43_318600_g318_i0_p2_ORF_typecomplete_len546_score111_52IMP2_N/PF18590_1/0_00015FdhDNarQ/PF02634_15/2_3e02FdhDNarQ/PF02634_15/1_1_NODE_389_length_8981_cov_43_318600_g318_i046856322